MKTTLNGSRQEGTMKTITTVLATLGATASLAWAGEGAETNGSSSLFVFLFLGFGVLIILCQLIPGLVLFCSMIKGLFSSPVKTMPVKGETTE